jgi:branched-subunit amino acid aminotransferase/4-amino-4-deoxychorismate lyase
MAKFEGIHWASHQMRYSLSDKAFSILPSGSRVFAVSRSVHYALFLAFEGIRFYCRRTAEGGLEAVFLNWRQNLERLRRAMLFNIGEGKAGLVPTADELESIFIQSYFRAGELRPFFEEMAVLGAQGYFRPFTVDEEESIGVTFPNQPSVRAAVSRYDRYLGEPFSGVVVPHLVRAVSGNRTGCLKLGINYVMSVKAVEAAQKIDPDAASALFLDDNPRGRLEDRRITEWDSSCCLFAFRDGTIVKIPESELILPSVTIQGIVAILKDKGVPVEERHLTYGELLARVKANELVAVSSIGTAGILNRCQKLSLTDMEGNVLAVHVSDPGHPLFGKLAEARETYWNIYKGAAKPTAGMSLSTYAL